MFFNSYLHDLLFTKLYILIAAIIGIVFACFCCPLLLVVITIFVCGLLLKFCESIKVKDFLFLEL